MTAVNILAVFDFLPTPVIICERETITYRNKSAEAIFCTEEAVGQSIFTFMPEDLWQVALREKSVEMTWNGVSIPIFLQREGNRYFLSGDITETAFAARREFLEKHERTGELSELFDIYMDENIWVTDGNGKTIFVSAAVARKHGVLRESILGRYVQDLETEKIFFPSVTMEVIRNNRQSAVLQQTINGRFCVAVGIPIFDSAGNIERIISITRECESQIETAQALAFDEPFQTSQPAYAAFAPRFATCNAAMHSVLQDADFAASTDSTILIQGESGVGKSLLAKLIHEASPRQAEPFIIINCAVIDEKLFESEMFGYVPGAFTGADRQGKTGLIELAQGGTLFLDEIEEMPLAQQVKLLEVIQERSIKRVGGTKRLPLNVRIICAAKDNLANLVATSKFRMDLFYRLNVVTLTIPPLRERKEDLPHLVHHISGRINRDYGLSKHFSQGALEVLRHHDYPGNVRELAHIAEQAMVMSRNRVVDIPDLPEKLRKSDTSPEVDVVVPGIMPLEAAIHQTEEGLLQLALRKYTRKKDIAAKLQVSQATLWRKMHKHGMRQDLE